jgi:hypothetical protein
MAAANYPISKEIIEIKRGVAPGMENFFLRNGKIQDQPGRFPTEQAK